MRKMQKFTYRKNTKIFGWIVDENENYWVIEKAGENDTVTWLKKLTVIEEI